MIFQKDTALASAFRASETTSSFSAASGKSSAAAGAAAPASAPAPSPTLMDRESSERGWPLQLSLKALYQPKGAFATSYSSWRASCSPRRTSTAAAGEERLELRWA